ncbi:hypothetical protein SASPL_126839 [Salvia splendens]|uniref:Remorin C-terminal domain-containing protein n=1 Tax=Salvia splendens TaxID=180675 RepID=A0A8X8XMK6_SALSN|nr:remorin 4.1-like [Salvia splendens]KAG6414121.1 hypothetical protein SASPL_126839 [Salvia splendens]
MSSDQRVLSLANTFQDGDGDEDGGGSPAVRDIHALTPPRAPRLREAWETGSHRSSSLSVASNATEGGGENFTSMSREFNALVVAGATINGPNQHESGPLGRIREEGNFQVETNPLAIVPDTGTLDLVQSPRGESGGDRHAPVAASAGGEMSVHRVKKEEAESKIYAWQNAKVAKFNNRFKREEAIINGWEGEQVQKATSWMKKVERKLEEKRAKAQEKMQNEIAKAHRKAEERRASAEAKRGTKVARILEIANLMRAVGRPPVKRSFF